MRLKKLLAEGQFRRHRTSPREISELFAVVEHDLKDANQPALSLDRRFATAYNAALQLATVALHAAGYRTGGQGHHWATLHVLPEIMGSKTQKLSDYLDACRTKRVMSQTMIEPAKFRKLKSLKSWMKSENFVGIWSSGSEAVNPIYFPMNNRSTEKIKVWIWTAGDE